MGEAQLWQSDGLGTDKDTLGKVLRIFRCDGVQGIQSQQALNAYIRKLDDSKLREMYEIDEEAAIQILVDCFGAAAAFRKYALIAEYIGVNLKELKEAGWISPAAYAEVVGKYEERTRRLEEERDGLLSKYANAIQRVENADKQREDLQNTLAHYKADLYDFYAQAGESQVITDTRYIETIAFMGWNIELTREGFLHFLENNQEIRLIGKPKRTGSLHAVGKDGTRYFTINPIDRDIDIMREIGGHRIDQLILCDDERRMIYSKHREIIHKIHSRFTDQIPEEYKILFYEY